MMSVSLNAHAAFAAPVPQSEVSLFHLYGLRAGYLMIAALMGGQIWPLMFHHRPWDLMHGVANSMLAAMTALAVLGLRYPLKMLPLLYFEMAWKTIWLTMIALPLWRAGHMDADTADTVTACLMVVIFPVVIPWRYVWTQFGTAPGDRWR